MARYTRNTYNRRVMLLMAIYVALMLLVWPHARNAVGVPLKCALALAPVLPVVVMVWLMARRVMFSDELEQRVHMVALSMATGAVAILSLIGGFLCAADVLKLDGDVLIWVFPLLCVVYSGMCGLLGRRYGGAGCE